MLDKRILENYRIENYFIFNKIETISTVYKSKGVKLNIYTGPVRNMLEPNSFTMILEGQYCIEESGEIKKWLESRNFIDKNNIIYNFGHCVGRATRIVEKYIPDSLNTWISYYPYFERLGIL